ncbi:MAG: hypothetical protein AN487_21595 [Anabaena sp. CRKS33]|nr:MAG: hypothetical protein AN487_21595 [Anabaena sp. CRKS33]
MEFNCFLDELSLRNTQLFNYSNHQNPNPNKNPVNPLILDILIQTKIFNYSNHQNPNLNKNPVNPLILDILIQTKIFNYSNHQSHVAWVKQQRSPTKE